MTLGPWKGPFYVDAHPRRPPERAGLWQRWLSAVHKVAGDEQNLENRAQNNRLFQRIAHIIFWMVKTKIRASRIGGRHLRPAKPERMVGVNDDVSELGSKGVYREAASMAGVVGVWDWDIANDVFTWDPVMVGLSGPRVEEFQGTLKAWEQAVHPDDKAFVMQELQAALRG